VVLRAKEGQLEELSRAGQQALKSQPFSALIGARLTSLSEGKAVLEVTIREELLQKTGYVHGGVISYIADNALTFAGGSVLGPAVLTSEYKINYLGPASGETLVVRASVVNAGRRQAVCRCEVLTTGAGRKETFCAAAQGSIGSEGGVMSVERLPDFALDDGRPLGREFAALGLGSYREAARYVRSLPYGRNTDRSDWRVVLKEGRGACSTKHALLAELARENGRHL
jgi:uncharacterized protein (TIGR00369 family)